jgi:hypothetical protein
VEVDSINRSGPRSDELSTRERKERGCGEGGVCILCVPVAKKNINLCACDSEECLSVNLEKKKI